MAPAAQRANLANDRQAAMKASRQAWKTFLGTQSVTSAIRAVDQLTGTTSSQEGEGVVKAVGKEFLDALVNRVKSSVTWKDQALFKKLGERASRPEYSSEPMKGLSILISGAGPSGLRAAIEAASHGANVTIVELRTEFSRKNCLHLWPFMVEDLRSLHIKHFYPAFCSGAVEHVNIADLQMALLKMALLLGVKIHCNVSIKAIVLLDQPEGTRIRLTRPIPAVEEQHYDALLAADGEHSNVLNILNFEKKYFHGGRSIGITCNFKNTRTSAEAAAEELAIASQYHQQFFGKMYEEHGIQLENLTYYRDDTHYFVMTATKKSLLERGVILQDGPGDIVNPSNIDIDELAKFVYDVGDYCDLGFDLELLENSAGKPDVQIFDYSTKHIVCEPSKMIFPKSRCPLLVMAIGDAALAPFWPLGTGANRGTLMALDACWILRSLSAQKAKGTINYDSLLRKHKKLFTVLKKTGAQNLKDHSQSIHTPNPYHAKTGHFSVDPSTRYFTV